MRKIAISLPSGLLHEIERVRTESGENRSAIVRRALEGFLAERAREARAEAYVRGYLTLPEELSEVAAAEALAEESLADQEWR